MTSTAGCRRAAARIVVQASRGVAGIDGALATLRGEVLAGADNPWLALLGEIKPSFTIWLL